MGDAGERVWTATIQVHGVSYSGDFDKILIR